MDTGERVPHRGSELVASFRVDAKLMRVELQRKVIESHYEDRIRVSHTLIMSECQLTQIGGVQVDLSRRHGDYKARSVSDVKVFAAVFIPYAVYIYA